MCVVLVAERSRFSWSPLCVCTVFAKLIWPFVSTTWRKGKQPNRMVPLSIYLITNACRNVFGWRRSVLFCWSIFWCWCTIPFLWIFHVVILGTGDILYSGSVIPFQCGQSVQHHFQQHIHQHHRSQCASSWYCCLFCHNHSIYSLCVDQPTKRRTEKSSDLWTRYYLEYFRCVVCCTPAKF